MYATCKQPRLPFGYLFLTVAYPIVDATTRIDYEMDFLSP